MKNNITELVFILDRSGSMAPLVSDTIGGFNAMLDRQKREQGGCYVTTVLFDNRIDILHDRLPLEKVPPMTRKEYQPGGSTALLDAVGDTVRHIARIHRYARPEDVPENTVVVITTDGLENASRRYRRDEIKKLIEHEQEKYGWTFLFLGANIDAFETAEGLGIDRQHSSNFHADGRGLGAGFRSMDRAVSGVRREKAVPLAWKEEVEADFYGRSD